MSKRVLINWPVLELLNLNIPDSTLKNIVKELSENQVLALAELAINILYGTIEITSIEKENLSKHRKVIKYLADRGYSVYSKRRYITQHRAALIDIVKASEKHIRPLLLYNHEKGGEKRDCPLGEVCPTDKTCETNDDHQDLPTHD